MDAYVAPGVVARVAAERADLCDLRIRQAAGDTFTSAMSGLSAVEDRDRRIWGGIRAVAGDYQFVALPLAFP
jgi:hypothetical protein